MQGVLGIVCGGGSLPRRLIQHCITHHIPYHVIAIKGQADAADVVPHPHTWVRIGAGRKIYLALKNNNISDVVMIGKLKRPRLFQLRPDWFLFKLLPQLGLACLGDDGLLRNVIKIIENLGFRVRGVHEFLPELLAPSGVLTRVGPDDASFQDIKKGIDTAQALGSADIGQAVVIQNGIVIATENNDGTDAMLKAALRNRQKGEGGVLVKLCKPQQDKRVDMPTIGVRTVENALSAKLSGIAVSSGSTLIDDIEGTIATADRHGLFIIGVSL